MPMAVQSEMPADWESCASRKVYGELTVTVPAVHDLLIPKLKRAELLDKINAK